MEDEGKDVRKWGKAECDVTWQLPAPPGSTTLRVLPLQSPRDSSRVRSLSVSAARDQVGCDREQGEGKGDPGQVCPQ
jgi:hypothetical protein